MSNKPNNSELDYYELRRRHEEYKQRARNTSAAEAPRSMRAAESDTLRNGFETPYPVQEAEPLIKHEAPDAQLGSNHDDDELLIDTAQESEEDFIDDEAEYETEDQAENNPNPFDSFIRFFRSTKSKLAARRAVKYDEIDEESLTDEELAALNDEDEEPADEENADQSTHSYAANTTQETHTVRPRLEDAPSDQAFDIEDEAFPSDKQSENSSNQDDRFEDEDVDDDSFEEERPRKSFDRSKLKSFINLFVERIDKEDTEDDESAEDDNGFGTLSDDDSDDDIEQPDQTSIPVPVKRPGLRERRSNAELVPESKPSAQAKPDHSSHAEIKGGHSMEQSNKPAADASQQELMNRLETSGMTRRERRELAERLAAEEAARKAAEAPIVLENSESSVPQPAAELVEEPTRIFTPISRQDAPAGNTDDLLSFETIEDEDSSLRRSRKAARSRDEEPKRTSRLFDEDDDDDDEDDEDDAPRSRRKSKSKKPSRKHYDDDDDDFDDDFDEDEDEDEDEEEEEEEKPSRRFSRSKRVSRYDDDDDEDDYDDDEDDEDEDEYDDDDDEYDEYDDDDDDDDDNDYDDDDDEYEDARGRKSHSVGYHIGHGLLWMLGILMVLALGVIVLNFLYTTGKPTIIPKMHELMGDSTAFKTLFPVYERNDVQTSNEIADIDDSFSGADALQDGFSDEFGADTGDDLADLPDLDFSDEGSEALGAIPSLDDTGAAG